MKSWEKKQTHKRKPTSEISYICYIGQVAQDNKVVISSRPNINNLLWYSLYRSKKDINFGLIHRFLYSLRKNAPIPKTDPWMVLIMIHFYSYE